MTSQVKSRQSLVIVVVLVIILGTALHLFTGREKIFIEHGSKSYGTLAESLVANQTLALDQVTPTAYRPPLYPVFLAGLLWLTGTLQTALATQSLMMGLMLGILALIALQFSPNWWLALVILLLYAYMDDIVLENITQRDTALFTFLLVMAGFVFISLNKHYHWWKVVLWAGLLGLIALVRPMAAMGVVFAVLWAFYLKFQRVNLANITRRVALFLLLFYLVLIPWGIRNWVSLGRFTFTTTSSGLNLWKGNNPGTATFYPALDVDVLDDLITDPPEESGWWDSLRGVADLSETEQNDYFQQLALTHILKNPSEFLMMGLVKLYALWLPQHHPTAKGDVEWAADWVNVDKFENHRFPLLPYLLLYVLAGVGYWRLKNTEFGWYLLFWVLCLSLIHFITFGETRFRWPINVLSLPLAAIGLEIIIISARKTLTGTNNPKEIELQRTH